MIEFTYILRLLEKILSFKFHQNTHKNKKKSEKTDFFCDERLSTVSMAYFLQLAFLKFRNVFLILLGFGLQVVRVDKIGLWSFPTPSRTLIVAMSQISAERMVRCDL